ncbi:MULTISPECIES: hypothetical protein [Selenomonas]|jgi:hypothetical protein|uniref:Uncharacterized protein n=1 Tax=Selenomonas ruminantium TaxID=971 RepID=A0A1K1P6D3_SELRU|nr:MULTISPECIES: hypothetical protein [Selenomonas]SEA28702.1 hypothetical protein SAMN05660648_02644 [Selenomonas ruminantium]SFA82421.1 hypothetical protein SAMN05216587_10239 [Selenomonas ruminantium]SFW43057.1 hypothetical protein SAMN02910323_1829 [Selenomonas ruminantium]
MKMRWGAGILAAAMLFMAQPQAQADEVISPDIYQWVQSTSRQNYFFNKQHMYFGQDSKGILDANIMLVPVLKTYDSVQIQDVQAKRRWKMLPMEGYEALVGTAEYLRFDLAQGTVTVVKHEDLDEDWGVLSVTTSDKAVKIADLSEKDVDGVFYKAILKYAYAHIDDMVERTEKNKRAKVNDAVKKKIAELKKPAEKQAAQESKDSKKDNKKKKAD